MEEAVFQGPEVVVFGFEGLSIYNTLEYMEKNDDKEKTKVLEENIKQIASEFKTTVKAHFKDYNLATDKKLFASLLKMYYDNVDKKFHPFYSVKKKKGEEKIFLFEQALKKHKCFDKYADYVYENSILVNEEKMMAFLDKPTYKAIEQDAGIVVVSSMLTTIRSLYQNIGSINSKIDKGNRLFVDGLRKMNKSTNYYPNANSTMRLSYGKVLDYYPADAVHYDYVSHLSGVMDKEDPNNDEFIVPKKLKELYEAKDFGRYGTKDGRLVVCFLTDNDITGGNSGSPVINGDGHLIGVAFDGNWEAMSGDIAFEQKLQRTINADIRYVLFIIDKYAGATNLIDEMTIIE